MMAFGKIAGNNQNDFMKYFLLVSHEVMNLNGVITLILCLLLEIETIMRVL